MPEQPDEAAADFPRAVIIVLRNDHGAIALADRDQMKRRREAAARDERGDELGEALLVVGRHWRMIAESLSVDIWRSGSF